jgi:uncharacterized damage-inducible protein DinB
MAKTPDGRDIPPLRAGEREMLESWLDFHRATLARKCEDLDDRQARTASVAPSPMTVVGLVRHLTEVERNWFQRVLAGRTDLPRVHPESGDAGFALPAGDDAPRLAVALADWRAEVSRSRGTAARVSLDDCGTFSDEDAARAGGREVSLRWILLHLIEEYARHNGHADLIRERIDGVTGT